KMKQHRILTLFFIVGVFLGIYMVNGEKDFRDSRGNKRITQIHVKFDKRISPPTTFSNSPNRSTELYSCPDPFLPNLTPSVKSYLVLPNKRECQAITVLCLNASLLMFLSVTFFYIGDHRKIQCLDDYTQADMANNSLCGVQGIVLTFATYATILYCFLLIIQLHFQTVWRCGIIQRHYLIAQGLVLFISLIFTVLPAATQQISFEFGASQCLLNDDFDFEDSLCESSVSTTIQSVTGKEVLNSIKIQWRALALSMIFLVTFMVYWLFIHVAETKLTPLKGPSESPSWIIEWINCILNNNSQDYCYSTISKYYVPSIKLMWVAESLTAILGINTFVVFGTNINLWNEWKAWFRNRYGGVDK
ncbi:5353_t:CDS:2, partial [Acaulospora colombiana]